MAQQYPAGWYAQPDGSQRYWDGSQWTNHWVPPASQQQPAAHQPPQQQPAAHQAPQQQPAAHQAPQQQPSGYQVQAPQQQPAGYQAQAPRPAAQPQPAYAPQPQASPAQKRRWVTSLWVLIPAAVVLVFLASALLRGFGGFEGLLPAPSPVAPSETAIAQPSPSADPTATVVESSAQIPEEEWTADQAEAVRSAEQYLDFTSFSRSGLIDQLAFEGFSDADASFAVDQLDVDWNEQAVKKAADMIEITPFSEVGLIDMLEYDGFTPEQAAHGVAGIEVDWNEQATLSAQRYLEINTFTREELIAQLEYEDFTREQADYAADAVGLR